MSQTLQPAGSDYNTVLVPSSPGPSFDINLNYGLFEPLSGTSSPLTHSPKRETSPSIHSLFSSDDDVLNEDQTNLSYGSSSTRRYRETPAFVDLTESPPPPHQVAGQSHTMANTRQRRHLTRETSSRPTASAPNSSGRSRLRMSRLSSSSSSRVSPTTRQASNGVDEQRSRKRRRVDSSPTEVETRRSNRLRRTESLDFGRDTGIIDPSITGGVDVDENPPHGPQPPTRSPDIEIEEVDLTGVNNPASLANALSKQREDAVKAQLHSNTSREDEGRTVLTAYKCPICMDVLEDATSTICGHLFCHKCIMDTLRFSEQQRAEESAGRPKGTCPVCRKPMARSDKQDKTRTLIPLGLKLQLSTKKKGKSKEI